MATEKDKINTGLLGAIAAVLTLSVVGIAFAVTALVRSAEDDQVVTKSADAAKPWAEATKLQNDDLTAPAAWADKGKGTASVPIDRAMAIVVEKIQQDPSWATPAPPPPPEDAGTDDAAAEGADGGTADDDAGEAGATGETDAATAPTGDAPEPKPEGAQPAPAPVPAAPTAAPTAAPAPAPSAAP